MSQLLERMQHPARIARNAVELAAKEIAASPVTFDRAMVGELLRQTVAGLYLALDTTPEEAAHAEALHEAAARVGDAERILEKSRTGQPASTTLDRPLAILVDARRHLLQHAEVVTEEHMRLLSDPRRWMVVSAHGDASRDVAPFRASVGMPQLHVLRRPRLAPTLELGENQPTTATAPTPRIPTPRTLEELEAFSAAATTGKLQASLLAEPEEDVPPPPLEIVYAYEPAVEEREVLRKMARDTLEDIGSLGNLRHPIPTETWLDQEPFEQRLFDNVDYFASLGPGVLGHIATYHRESEVPDAMRAFAFAFTLGCIEGRDTAGLVVSVLKQRPKEEWPGFVDGLTLAPNPAVDEVLPELLTHPAPGLAALAIDVLGGRGSLTTEVVGWIRARRDPTLDARLAEALAGALDRDVAIACLEELLHAGHHGDDDALFCAAARSLMIRGHGPARDALRSELAAHTSIVRLESAIELIAIAGRADDCLGLLDAITALPGPTPRVLRALGRFGHIGTLSYLVDTLRRFEGDELVTEATGEALERITGAGLRRTVEEPWETGLPPELRSAAEAVGATTPMRTVEKVILDPAQWDEWGRAHLRELDPRIKHRGGRPFSPAGVVDELEAKSTPCVRRPDVAFELGCILGTLGGFRPDDWVTRQRAQLAHLRAETASLDHAPGCWWFHRRSSRGGASFGPDASGG